MEEGKCNLIKLPLHPFHHKFKKTDKEEAEI